MRGRKVGYRKHSYCLGKLFSGSLESFYWLGFIAADGCITNQNLVISISTKDSKHLDNFCSFINTDFMPKEKLIGEKYKAAYVSLRLSKEELESFSQFNIVPRKTLIYEPPVIEDHESKLAFIVGYIDGDGSFNWSKRDNNLRLGIRGTLETLSWIRDALQIPNKVGHDTNCHHLQFSGKKAEILRSRLARIDVPKLHRKWYSSNNG